MRNKFGSQASADLQKLRHLTISASGVDPIGILYSSSIPAGNS